MPGVDELAFGLSAVAKALREAGEGGLVRELSRAIGDAVAPAMQEIHGGLSEYLPDRYAEVLGDDLRIRRSTSTTGEEARVTILASPGGTKKRKLALLEQGFINHPVFAQGPRRRPRHHRPEDLARKLGVPVHLVSGWTWVNGQTKGMKPGFFAHPLEAAEPQVRDAIEAALENVAAKAAGKGL